MLPLLIAGFITLGFAGFLVNSGSSDEEAPVDEDLPPEDGGDEEDVNVLFPEGDAHLIGTEGDDYLDLSGPEFDTSDLGDLDRVSLGAGDDTVTADRWLEGITLEGGAGDDLFDLEHAGAVSGGDGDDTITVGAFTAVDGGTGDDHIFVDLRDLMHVGTPPLTEGGAGDDTMAAAVDVYSEDLYASEVHLVGGEGTDSYELTLQVNPALWPEVPSTDPVEMRSGIQISGWDVEDEPLVIDLQYEVGAEGRELADITIERNLSPSAGENDYLLYVMLEGTETMGPARVSIGLNDVMGVPTAADVTVLSHLPAAA